MSFLNFLNQWSGVVLALANVVLALATIVLALGIPWSIRAGSREERDTFYAVLDQTYFEIQKLLIEHPHFADPNPATKSSEQLIQYDAYAYAVWNFLESIVDYSRDEKFLAETWDPVLRHEAALHAAWFLKPENRAKFKQPFLSHMELGGYVPRFKATTGHSSSRPAQP